MHWLAYIFILDVNLDREEMLLGITVDTIESFVEIKAFTAHLNIERVIIIKYIIMMKLVILAIAYGTVWFRRIKILKKIKTSKIAIIPLIVSIHNFWLLTIYTIFGSFDESNYATSFQPLISSLFCNNLFRRLFVGKF